MRYVIGDLGAEEPSLELSRLLCVGTARSPDSGPASGRRGYRERRRTVGALHCVVVVVVVAIMGVFLPAAPPEISSWLNNNTMVREIKGGRKEVKRIESLRGQPSA